MNQLKKIINEQILKEFDLKIDPTLSSKIYYALIKKIPNFNKDFPTKLSFFYYINGKL